MFYNALVAMIVGLPLLLGVLTFAVSMAILVHKGWEQVLIQPRSTLRMIALRSMPNVAPGCGLGLILELVGWQGIVDSVLTMLIFGISLAVYLAAHAAKDRLLCE